MTLLDLKLTGRRLAKDARFTTVAVMTLALGIGACTAIFSVLYGVVLRPLPYPSPAQLVHVYQVFEKGNYGSFSDPNFEDLREQSRSFGALAQYSTGTRSVAGGSLPTRALVAAVSRDFLPAFGIEPLHGRRFIPEELHEGASPVVLVSNGFWQRHLAGEADLSSLQLRFDGLIFQVVGVMPPAFDFPPGTELWVPREQIPRIPSRTAHNWKAVGRLAASVSLERARSDVSAVAHRLKRRYGDDTWMVDAAVVPLREHLVGSVRPALLVLTAAVGLLLLVACANVANLLLARATMRQREIAVSTALGAGRWRLVRLFFAEALVLSGLGTALGIALAASGVRILLAIQPGNLPRTEEIGISLPVLLMAVGVALVVTLMLGLTTAWRITRLDPHRSLMDGQRGLSGAPGRRFRSLLVASQVALTLILLFGTGLLVRSLLNLLSVDPGFRVGQQVVVDLFHPPPDNEEEKRRLGQVHRDLLDRLRRLPGVVRAGGIDLLPLSSGHRNGVFLVLQPGETVTDFEDFGRLMDEPGRAGNGEYRAASSGYFETMGIELLRGRTFDERDTSDSLHVAVVSESVVKDKWPDRDPLGRLIEFGNMDGDLRPLTVIGVVADIHHKGLDAPVRPTIYTNALQRPPSGFSIIMDVELEPDAMVSPARNVVHALAPDVPPRFRTVTQVVSASYSEPRFNVILVSLFGATALILACMGIYGVASYSVSQRVGEIGVRLALGARPSDVLQMILREGAGWIALGVFAGALGALGLTRLMRHMLFGIDPGDPLTLLVMVLPLVAATLAACGVPALRAARLDPMNALRYE